MHRAVVLAFVAACTEQPPADAVPAISAEAMVSLDGASVRTSLVLRDIRNPSVPLGALEPDEHLTVRFRDAMADLAVSPALPGFSATLPVTGAVAADETITVMIERTDLTSVLVGTFPPPFDLVLPAQGSATQPIDVTWSPTASDAMAWRGQGCAAQGLEAADGPIRGDTGMLEIPTGVLASGGLTAPCTIPLALDRTRTTLVPSALYYASIAVTRTVSGELTVSP